MTTKILVVDDQQTMRRILRSLLSQVGFTDVHEAADGSAALTMLKAGGFQLIVSDWNMAPMTGIELLRHVRADPGLQALPFIMVTAESKAENIMLARQAGASTYIVKPFNAATLREKIQAVMPT